MLNSPSNSRDKAQGSQHNTRLHNQTRGIAQLVEVLRYKPEGRGFDYYAEQDGR